MIRDLGVTLMFFTPHSRPYYNFLLFFPKPVKFNLKIRIRVNAFPELTLPQLLELLLLQQQHGYRCCFQFDIYAKMLLRKSRTFPAAFAAVAAVLCRGCSGEEETRLLPLNLFCILHWLTFLRRWLTCFASNSSLARFSPSIFDAIDVTDSSGQANGKAMSVFTKGRRGGQ